MQPKQKTIIFSYSTAQGPAAGDGRVGEGWGEEAVSKTLFANRQSPAAAGGNEKLSFGKPGPICNNT